MTRYPTVFHLISAVCKKAGVSCVLVGGFAVNYYKFTRQTADVDFLISSEDFDKILPLLTEAGYKIDYAQDVFARLKGASSYSMDLDFMFVDRRTISEFAAHGKKITIAAQTMIIPSLEHLIALKLHSIKHNPKLREYKDLPDIIQLVIMNKVDVKNSKFKDLCIKYGTEELYHKLVKAV